MNSVSEDKQITLRNTCEGLEDKPVLARFAKKLQDGYEITLTPKEVKKLYNYLSILKHGFTATVPITCMGEQCPYTHKCPLGGNNNYPIGKNCPVEDTLKDIWFQNYSEDLEIDPESKVDTALVGDLVFWEMLEKRATEELAKKPEIMRKNVAGFQQTDQGSKPIYKDEMNQIINFLEKAQRQKLKIMNALIATREAKSKDINRVISDPCYDEETEVLTDVGWKYLRDVSDSDKICSLIQKTFNIVYSYPTMIYSNKYNGKMYSLKTTKRNIDLLVTPNHKLFTGELKAAEDLYGSKSIQFYKSGKWIGKRKEFYTLPFLSSPGHKWKRKKIKIDNWLEFLGYYLSEGAIVFNKRKDSKSGSYVITFYQKDDNSLFKILNACKKVTSAKILLTGKDNHTIRFCDKRLYNVLKLLGNKYNKYIPREFFDLRRSKLKILFDALMLGDGRTNNNGGSYYCTSSDNLKDDFQELLLKLGYSGISYIKHKAGDKVWFSKENRYITATKDHWRIMITFKNNSPKITKRKEEWVNYSGNIYCVEVPSHVIYVRRNGCTFWCGNSTYAAKLMEKAREFTKKAEDIGGIPTDAEVVDETE